MKEQPQAAHGSLLLLTRTTAHRIWKIVVDERGARRGAEIRKALTYFAHAGKRIALRNRSFLVVSRPKSGRTWLRFMLDELGVHLQYTHHDDGLPLPEEWRNRKIIFLHRDPRDTLTSDWFARRTRHGDYTGTLGELLREPEEGLERIIRYNLFWGEKAARGGGIVTTYEALQHDTAAELGRIAGFIRGAPPRPAALGEAVRAGAFQNMRALEESGEGAKRYGNALTPGDPGDFDSYKTRRGVVGDWRSHFTADDAAFADEILAKHDYFGRMRGFYR